MIPTLIPKVDSYPIKWINLRARKNQLTIILNLNYIIMGSDVGGKPWMIHINGE